MAFRAIKILVATNHLDNFGGTESYTYAIIEELKRKKLDVEYFTFKRGEVSRRIESNLNVYFMSKNKYDLILANHITCIKSLYRKGIVIQTCHGIFPDLEQPSRFSDYYVSISLEVKEYLRKKGFKSTIIHNGINCDRFKELNPVSTQIKSVLSLCQSQTASNKVKLICEKNNWVFISLNKFENGVWDIENYINKADIVVGLGRSAYEAMACGRPVIVYDDRSYFQSFSDGYLDLRKIKKSIKCNCSGREFKYNLDLNGLEKEFKKFNSQDGKILSNYICKELNIEYIVSKYLSIFNRINWIKRKILFFIKIKHLILNKIKQF